MGAFDGGLKLCVTDNKSDALGTDPFLLLHTPDIFSLILKTLRTHDIFSLILKTLRTHDIFSLILPL